VDQEGACARGRGEVGCCGLGFLRAAPSAPFFSYALRFAGRGVRRKEVSLLLAEDAVAAITLGIQSNAKMWLVATLARC
jgi:hypothetical protein